MPRTDKEKAIREACIKANPEIVELKFGCEVKCRFDAVGFPNEGSLEYHAAIEEIGYVTHDDFLEISHNFQDLPVKEIVDGYLGEEYDGMFCEILGRPIRLADILLAVGEATKFDSGTKELNVIHAPEWLKRN